MIPLPLAFCAFLACATLIAARASDGAFPESASAHQSPVIIYVDRFSTQDILDKANDLSFLGEDNESGGPRPHFLGKLLGAHQEQQEYGLLQKLPTILQKTLVQNLNQSIARAAEGDGMLATQLNCWVIRGRFVVVDGGGRATQTGSGQSHVEIHAWIYTLNDPDTPFLSFDAKGASGHAPGENAAKNPYSIAVKFMMANKEPEKEARRVGQQIAEELGKFMTAQDIPTLAALKASGMASPPAVPDKSQVSPVYSSKGNAS